MDENRSIRDVGSSDLYGTGSQIFKTIISSNLRVYNTRVRSGCKSKKVIPKNSRFLLQQSGAADPLPSFFIRGRRKERVW